LQEICLNKSSTSLPTTDSISEATRHDPRMW